MGKRTPEEEAARAQEKKDKRARKRATKESASLSAFLLAQVDAKDAALDDIFANSKGPSEVLKAENKEKKRKKERVLDPVPQPEPEPQAEHDEEELANDAELSELDSDAELSGFDEDEEEDDAGVEEAYAARMVAEKLKANSEGAGKKRKATAVEEEEEEGDESETDSGMDDDGEIDLDELVHESVAALRPATEKEKEKLKAKDRKREKALAHADEASEVRDARTIFLGNVPVTCSTSRPMKKALLRHVLQSPKLLDLLPPSCPTLKADSIRFRSLAFASTIFGRKADAPPIDHGRKRARDWRDAESTDARGVRGGFREKEKDADVVRVSKQPLTEGQKRKVAFIKGEVNEGKKVCNAYLVLERLPESGAGDQLSTDELVKLVVAATDGSVFEGLTLRADRVRPKSAAASSAPKADTATSIQPTTYSVPPAEARRTVFMGGLDFAESEENIRAATEAVLARERGPAVGSSWVESVRLIRDASTGLGKGFGYVLLKDPECVDELLALPFGKPLKVSKRKPRLERCKSGVAAARAKAASIAAREAKPIIGAGGSTSVSSTTNKRKDRDGPAAPKKPRMSTSVSEHQAKLAEALAKLPAEERKAIKAVDPERLWRRAEKKKNKVLSERYERKKANGSAKDILGRETRGEERKRKEKKRVAAGNKTGKRAKF